MTAVGSRLRRPRPQSGYTLIELLLVIMLSGIVFAPLMAWAGLAIRQQPVIQDGMLRTASAGLLGSYLPKDVAVAGRATNAPSAAPWSSSDCVGGAGANGTMQLVMITGGQIVDKVVYSQAKSSDDPARTSVWRRTCNPATGALLAETEVYPDVDPALTAVTCTDDATETCRRVQMAITPRTTGRSVVVSATRRLSSAAIPTDIYGNPAPIASIEITGRSGTAATTATFSAARSSVGPGRTIASYHWEFDPSHTVTVNSPGVNGSEIEATFQQPGSYTVLLTVTDDLGLTGTSYVWISTTDQAPVSVATVTPPTAVRGSTFTLDGQGSSDPDGSVASYEWIVDYPSADGVAASVQTTHSGAVVAVQPPASFLGIASVTLIVSDTQGQQHVGFTTFTVTDPSVPPTTPTSSVPTTDPGPGALVAAFTDAAGVGGSDRVFDASSSSGAGAGATHQWSFGDGASGSGITASHSYPNDGGYTVRLTVTTADGRTASTQRLVAVGGAAPAPTNLRDDGATLSWDPVPGALRYLVDFEFRTATDCFRQITEQAVGAGPNPAKAIPTNPCPASASGRARVGTDANGFVSWSDWVAIPANGAG